jgi:glycosyltransferase involved in cell wall biosynthesis
LAYSVLTSAAACVTRQLSRRAAKVIVMTAEMKRRLPISVQRRAHVLPMGIDTELFHPHDRATARAELGWGKGPVAVFCTLGSKGIKRPDLAQAAVGEARRQQPDLTLFFLHGIAPDRVPLVLSAADCLLVTSEREGSPNVVREGFACNLPVVSVPVGDVADLLERHPEAGALASRDPVALGKAIVEVLRRPRPDLRPILRECSLEATARRVIAIYQHVLGERAQEAPTGCEEPGSCVTQTEALARGVPHERFGLVKNKDFRSWR